MCAESSSKTPSHGPPRELWTCWLPLGRLCQPQLPPALVPACPIHRPPWLPPAHRPASHELGPPCSLPQPHRQDSLSSQWLSRKPGSPFRCLNVTSHHVRSHQQPGALQPPDGKRALPPRLLQLLSAPLMVPPAADQRQPCSNLTPRAQTFSTCAHSFPLSSVLLLKCGNPVWTPKTHIREKETRQGGFKKTWKKLWAPQRKKGWTPDGER